MSDNFHQAVEGGTGANHVMLGTGDAIWYQRRHGPRRWRPAVATRSRTPIRSAGTNNWYTQDGYSGGTYSDCADPTPARRRPVVDVPRDRRRASSPNCDAGHYYLLNNYKPGYFGDGTRQHRHSSPIPPSPVRDHRRRAARARGLVALLRRQLGPLRRRPDVREPRERLLRHLQSVPVRDVDHGERRGARRAHQGHDRSLRRHRRTASLPAVSIVKPSGLVDGHPASSKLDLFEGFSKKIVDAVQREARALAGHRDLRHVRRRRRLLRLGLRAAARLLRRRHAHPVDRGLAVHARRAHLARVRRPRLDPEVRRAQLGPAARSRRAAATTCRTRSRRPRTRGCRATVRRSTTSSISSRSVEASEERKRKKVRALTNDRRATRLERAAIHFVTSARRLRD